MPTSEHCHSSVHTTVIHNSDWNCEKICGYSEKFWSVYIKFHGYKKTRKKKQVICDFAAYRNILLSHLFWGLFLCLLNKTKINVLPFYSFFSMESGWQRTVLISRILKYFFLIHPRLSMKILPSYSQILRYLLFSQNKQTYKKPTCSLSPLQISLQVRKGK